jgi:hypothetical protein
VVIHGRSRIVEEENAQDNGVHMGKYKPFYTITNQLLSDDDCDYFLNEMVCVLKNMETMAITYKLSVTNLEFTLDLIENT